MLVRPRNVPSVTETFEAHLCWMSGDCSVMGKSYILRHTTREVSATIDEVVYRFDVESLHRVNALHLDLNDIGRVIITTGRPIFVRYFRAQSQYGLICFDRPGFQ